MRRVEVLTVRAAVLKDFKDKTGIGLPEEAWIHSQNIGQQEGLHCGSHSCRCVP